MFEDCAKIFLILFDTFEKGEVFHGVLSSTSFFASHRAFRFSKVRIREQAVVELCSVCLRLKNFCH